MLPIPNLSFASSSSARSGDAFMGGTDLGSPFNVNFGNGVTQGGGAPPWVWLAGLGVAVWLWKRR